MRFGREVCEGWFDLQSKERLKMGLKKIIKYVFIILGLGVFFFLSFFAYKFYTYMFWFGLEDRIVFSYEPVIKGIVAYQEKIGSFPSDIKDLIPEYIDNMPNLQEVKSFEYNIIEQKDWELVVIAEAKGMKKEFIYRTTLQLTPEEKKRLWTGCHDWYVLWIRK